MATKKRKEIESFDQIVERFSDAPSQTSSEPRSWGGDIAPFSGKTGTFDSFDDIMSKFTDSMTVRPEASPVTKKLLDTPLPSTFKFPSIIQPTSLTDAQKQFQLADKALSDYMASDEYKRHYINATYRDEAGNYRTRESDREKELKSERAKWERQSNIDTYNATLKKYMDAYGSMDDNAKAYVEMYDTAYWTSAKKDPIAKRMLEYYGEDGMKGLHNAWVKAKNAERTTAVSNFGKKAAQAVDDFKDDHAILGGAATIGLDALAVLSDAVVNPFISAVMAPERKIENYLDKEYPIADPNHAGNLLNALTGAYTGERSAQIAGTDEKSIKEREQALKEYNALSKSEKELLEQYWNDSWYEWVSDEDVKDGMKKDPKQLLEEKYGEKKLRAMYEAKDEQMLTLGKIESTLYSAAMSSAQSTAGVLTYGPLYTAGMGASEYQSSVSEYSRQGISTAKAEVASTLNAVIEGFTESKTVGRLEDAFFGSGNGLISAFNGEGFEEALGDCLKTAMEGVVLGYDSQLNQSVQEYVDQGMSREEAQKKTAIDFVKDTGYDYLVGGLSGMMGEATGAGYRAAVESAYSRAVNKAAESAFSEGKQETRTENVQQNEVSHEQAQTAQDAPIAPEPITAAPAQEKPVQTVDAPVRADVQETQTETQDIAPLPETKNAPAQDVTEAKAGQEIEDTGIELEKDFKDYPYDKQKVIKGYEDSTDQNILDFIAKHDRGETRNGEKIVVGTVSDKMSTDIESETGVSGKSGTKIYFNTSALEHIQKRHGEHGKHDFSMSNNEDIARINFVLQNYDGCGDVETSTSFLNKDGTPSKSLKFWKKINGTYFVVEAVPDSSKTWIVSAFMNKNGVDQTFNATESDPNSTSENASKSTPNGAVQVLDASSEAPSGNVQNVGASAPNEGTYVPNDQTVHGQESLTGDVQNEHTYSSTDSVDDIAPVVKQDKVETSTENDIAPIGENAEKNDSSNARTVARKADDTLDNAKAHLDKISSEDKHGVELQIADLYEKYKAGNGTSSTERRTQRGKLADLFFRSDRYHSVKNFLDYMVHLDSQNVGNEGSSDFDISEVKVTRNLSDDGEHFQFKVTFPDGKSIDGVSGLDYKSFYSQLQAVLTAYVDTPGAETALPLPPKIRDTFLDDLDVPYRAVAIASGIQNMYQDIRRKKGAEKAKRYSTAKFYGFRVTRWTPEFDSEKFYFCITDSKSKFGWNTRMGISPINEDVFYSAISAQIQDMLNYGLNGAVEYQHFDESILFEDNHETMEEVRNALAEEHSVSKPSDQETAAEAQPVPDDIGPVAKSEDTSTQHKDIFTGPTAPNEAMPQILSDIASMVEKSEADGDGMPKVGHAAYRGYLVTWNFENKFSVADSNHKLHTLVKPTTFAVRFPSGMTYNGIVPADASLLYSSVIDAFGTLENADPLMPDNDFEDVFDDGFDSDFEIAVNSEVSTDGDIAPIAPTKSKVSNKQNVADLTTKWVATEEEYKAQNPDDGKKQKRTKESRYKAPMPENATLSQRMRFAWDYAKNLFVDKGSVIEDIALRNKSPQLDAAYRMLNRVGAMSRNLVANGNAQKGVRSLDSIYKALGDSQTVSKFENYLLHLRNIDAGTMEKRGVGFNVKILGTITAKQSQEIVNAYNKSNPEFEALANDVYKYVNNLTDILVESGRISRDQADLQGVICPHYIPLQRMNDEANHSSDSLSGPDISDNDSGAKYAPILYTLAQYTGKVQHAATMNKFGIELLKATGNPNHVRNPWQSVYGRLALTETSSLPTDGLLTLDGDTPLFTVFQDGEKSKFRIDPQVYMDIKPKNDLLSMEIPGLAFMNDLRRASLTSLNPAFNLMRNPVKDAQEVHVNSKHAFLTYIHYPVAFFQLVMKGKAYQEYRNAGGADIGNFIRSNDSHFDPKKGVLDYVAGIHGLKQMAFLGNLSEQTPRLAEFMVSRKQGATIEQAMLDSARVTTDFSSGGEVTKAMDRNGFTFLNASVQGAWQHVRNFRQAKEAGLMGWVKLIAKYGTVPAGVALINSLFRGPDDDDEDDMSDYIHDRYYIGPKLADGRYLRIPKGRTDAVMLALVDEMKNLVTGDDDVDFKRFFKLFLDNMAPNNPFSNNILSPIIQTVKGKTWYGEDIVTSRLAKLPKHEQFDEKTDDFSVALADYFYEHWGVEASPKRINYLLENTTGVFGDTFLPLITPKATVNSDLPFANALAPLVDVFAVDPVIQDRSQGDFFDKLNDIEEKANSDDATDQDKILKSYMIGYNAKLSKLYEKQRNIQASDGKKNSEKYQEAREVRKKINAMEKEALDGLQEPIIIQGNYAKFAGKEFTRSQKDGTWYTYGTDKDNWYYKRSQAVTSAFDIPLSSYANNTDKYDDAYYLATHEKTDEAHYAIRTAEVLFGMDDFARYASDIHDIPVPDDGKKWKLVQAYVDGLDLEPMEKKILMKIWFPDDQSNKEDWQKKQDDDTMYDIFKWLDASDVSDDDFWKIARELGFLIDDQGNVTW